MNRLKKLKFTALVALLFLFIGVGAMSSCRDTKKKEDTEMSEEHAESEEHPEGAEHPTEAAEEHPTEEGDEHPEGEEHPTKKDSVGS
jgi:hypothetical protein